VSQGGRFAYSYSDKSGRHLLDVAVTRCPG
jgi:hypothetical protein